MGKLREAGIRVRKSLGAHIVAGSFGGLAKLGGMTPMANPRLHGVEVLRDIPYADDGHRAHTLDVYRPRDLQEGAPVVIYCHGGAFQFLSKDTHWLMGLIFARRGYVVFNVNYRLAPRDRFPAALEDVTRATLWVMENAARFGGDPRRIIAAGESAGANLASALMVASCYRRPEPYARAIWDSGLQFRAVVPACGMLQVSDCERFTRRRRLPLWLSDRLVEVGEAYLPRGLPPEAHALADPLLVLENDRPDRPLPPVFTFVGTADPLLDDTRRLKRALDAHGARCEVRYYEGGLHAFHALVWDPNARSAWRDKLRFLQGCLAESPAEALDEVMRPAG